MAVEATVNIFPVLNTVSTLAIEKDSQYPDRPPIRAGLLA